MDQLFHDADLVSFYDLENGWGADDAFCLGLAGGAARVLDLGCGTGRLIRRIARDTGALCVGVDPAAAMLDVARSYAETGSDGGEGVAWHCTSAEAFRSDQRFDLILMTGHAFQALVTRQARAAALITMAQHLAPGGRAIFDSRNPCAEEWRQWTKAKSLRTLTHPVFGVCQRWHDLVGTPASGLVTFRTTYARPGLPPLVAQSTIAFPDWSEIEELIVGAGLAPVSVLGNWRGDPFMPDSPEIIPVCMHP